MDYERAKLEAQRAMDDLSLSLHAAIDEACDAPAPSDDQVAVVALTSVKLEDDGDYLFRRGCYAMPLPMASDLIRWGRARAASEADIELHNRGAAV